MFCVKVRLKSEIPANIYWNEQRDGPRELVYVFVDHRGPAQVIDGGLTYDFPHRCGETIASVDSSDGDTVCDGRTCFSTMAEPAAPWNPPHAGRQAQPLGYLARRRALSG